MTDNVTNFLASGIEIKGTIRFQNDMHIDGKIEGEIISDKGKVTMVKPPKSRETSLPETSASTATWKARSPLTAANSSSRPVSSGT